ncbi:hypothetical protein VTN00DRAFT_250 [Thermoascus crustaceus]|uniref:uncharacterized protein n=1 Tax=Thermoascus crustaceus TaxID=5088 RepID=UPI003744126A
MHRFRKHKKAKEVVEDPEPSPAPSLSSKAFKKNKKEPEEPKPQFDLENALPSTDDFRTSLLMPKLSARFSMLREQDDPTTKVGKANDDSVLFPKRASRLNLFGHNPNPLSDIVEVSSIQGRPSFTSGRTNSFASGGDGYGTDDDRPYGVSIMTRPRPGEGNNLFGGRQKVYKIPVSKDSGGSGMRGRAYYDDDVGLSAFQKLRLREKEEKSAETADHQQETTAVDSEDASSGIFSTNRMTTSSTASGPSNRRTSTAATSIDEQQQSSSVGSTNDSKPNQAPTAAERGPAKPRRLYGQGLTDAVQNQQSSAMSRLESLSRQRAGTLELPQPNRSYSKSATNLHEKIQKFEPVRRSPGGRGASPPPSATSLEHHPMDTDHKDVGSSASPAATGHNFIRPLSPPVSENEDATLAAALHPQDRGKATAMGLFNKPSTQYDEQQFTRRQLQMHEGRNPVGDPRSASSGRPRGFSNASHRSTAESVSSRYSSEARRTGDDSATPSVRGSSSHRPTTFFSNSSNSESESDGEDDSPSQALDGMHPAVRSPADSKKEDDRNSIRESHITLPEVRYSDLGDLNSTIDLNTIVENDAAETPPSPIKEEGSEKTPDSPTLGPSDLGLSRLIRTHLRHNSDRSSIYPLPSPGFPPNLGDRNSQFVPDPSRFSVNFESSHSDVEKNSTEVKDSDSAPQPNVQSMAANMTMRAQQILNQAAALRDLENNSRDGPHTEKKGEEDDMPSQAEQKLEHKRNGSTETQKEREEFANELAERRKKVQEKLKMFEENESRSSSPVPGRQTPDYTQVKHGNAFAMLKNKSAKNSSAAKQDPKTTKMFGLGNATMNSSTPTLVSDEDEEKMSHEFGKHPNTSSHISGRSLWSRAQAMRRGSRDDSRESSRSRGPSPHSRNSPLGDRSSSELSGRSKSHTRYREDLGIVEESVAGYRGNRSSGESHGPASLPSSNRPSVDGYERSSSAASGRFSGNSRPMSPGCLDISPGNQFQTPDPSMIGVSPRPSPVTPYSANTTPPLYELSPDPSASSTPQSMARRGSTTTGLQKRVVDKSQISEPTFLSSTSNVPTVGLPPGASLSNGMEAPPVPPMNPRRRRQTTTQTILGALKGEKHEAPPPMPPSSETEEERSTFSDDEKRPRTRHLLRKISSEGPSLNKAPRENGTTGSPAVLQVSKHVPLDGGMF